jgi:hypothetical protein
MRGWSGAALSVEEFTSLNTDAADHIEAHQSNGIIVDGGPHTMWWSIQEPDGRAPQVKVPIPSLLQAMQPHARLIVTLAEPVQRMCVLAHRLDSPLVVACAWRSRRGRVPAVGTERETLLLFPRYSDYYFLGEHSVATSREGKSADDFRLVAQRSVVSMQQCLLQRDARAVLADNSRFTLRLEAEQACAYDRYHFGRPGTGRLAAGM